MMGVEDALSLNQNSIDWKVVKRKKKDKHKR